jgi:hypothetical protein
MERILSLIPIVPLLSQMVVAFINYGVGLARIAAILTLAFGGWQAAASMLGSQIFPACRTHKKSSRGDQR